MYQIKYNGSVISTDHETLKDAKQLADKLAAKYSVSKKLFEYKFYRICPTSRRGRDWGYNPRKAKKFSQGELSKDYLQYEAIR